MGWGVSSPWGPIKVRVSRTASPRADPELGRGSGPSTNSIQTAPLSPGWGPNRTYTPGRLQPSCSSSPIHPCSLQKAPRNPVIPVREAKSPSWWGAGQPQTLSRLNALSPHGGLHCDPTPDPRDQGLQDMEDRRQSVSHFHRARPGPVWLRADRVKAPEPAALLGQAEPVVSECQPGTRRSGQAVGPGQAGWGAPLPPGSCQAHRLPPVSL